MSAQPVTTTVAIARPLDRDDSSVRQEVQVAKPTVLEGTVEDAKRCIQALYKSIATSLKQETFGSDFWKSIATRISEVNSFWKSLNKVDKGAKASNTIMKGLLRLAKDACSVGWSPNVKDVKELLTLWTDDGLMEKGDTRRNEVFERVDIGDGESTLNVEMEIDGTGGLTEMVDSNNKRPTGKAQRDKGKESVVKKEDKKPSTTAQPAKKARGRSMSVHFNPRVVAEDESMVLRSESDSDVEIVASNVSATEDTISRTTRSSKAKPKVPAKVKSMGMKGPGPGQAEGSTAPFKRRATSRVTPKAIIESSAEEDDDSIGRIDKKVVSSKGESKKESGGDEIRGEMTRSSATAFPQVSDLETPSGDEGVPVVQELKCYLCFKKGEICIKKPSKHACQVCSSRKGRCDFEIMRKAALYEQCFNEASDLRRKLSDKTMEIDHLRASPMDIIDNAKPLVEEVHLPSNLERVCEQVIEEVQALKTSNTLLRSKVNSLEGRLTSTCNAMTSLEVLLRKIGETITTAEGGAVGAKPKAITEDHGQPEEGASSARRHISLPDAKSPVVWRRDPPLSAVSPHQVTSDAVSAIGLPSVRTREGSSVQAQDAPTVIAPEIPTVVPQETTSASTDHVPSAAAEEAPSLPMVEPLAQIHALPSPSLPINRSPSVALSNSPPQPLVGLPSPPADVISTVHTVVDLATNLENAVAAMPVQPLDTSSKPQPQILPNTHSTVQLYNAIDGHSLGHWQIPSGPLNDIPVNPPALKIKIPRAGKLSSSGPRTRSKMKTDDSDGPADDLEPVAKRRKLRSGSRS